MWMAIALIGIGTRKSKHRPFANFINLGNNITIINKPFGRSDIGIPASTRDFVINAIAMAYFNTR
jgi:hypothetical protein